MENTIGSRDYLSRNWWLLLLRGIAAIAFGVATFVWPGLTLSVLIIMFGAFILVDGIVGLIEVIRNRDKVRNRWFWLLESILGIVVGLLTLFMPGITALVLLSFIAVWSIFGGILRIVAAIQLRKEIDGEWLLILSGILSVIFGAVIILLPHAGLLSIIWLIGLWAITFGILFIALSFRLRNLHD